MRSAAQLTRLRKACLSLPDAHEVEAWGAPTFRVNNHVFAMYAHADNHHGEGREGVWIKCTPINQSLMLGANPKKFFYPPYTGPSGWIGYYLDIRVNWKELAGLLRDGYELTLKMKKGRPRTRAKSRKRTTSARRS